MCIESYRSNTGSGSRITRAPTPDHAFKTQNIFLKKKRTTWDRLGSSPSVTMMSAEVASPRRTTAEVVRGASPTAWLTPLPAAAASASSSSSTAAHLRHDERRLPPSLPPSLPVRKPRPLSRSALSSRVKNLCQGIESDDVCLLCSSVLYECAKKNKKYDEVNCNKIRSIKINIKVTKKNSVNLQKSLYAQQTLKYTLWTVIYMIDGINYGR